MKVGLRMNSFIHFFSNYSHHLNLRPLTVTQSLLYSDIYNCYTISYFFFVMLSGYYECDKYAI
jgi:hypothetical protein